MDESVMEKSISDYKEQLAQIEIVLCSCDEESRIELTHLKQDVIDLIKVTEESLLSLKKSRLLKELSADENRITTAAPEKQINEKKPGDSSTDFFGIKCRVRYTFDWGLTEFHNAMVVGSEETSDDQHKIKVLFMNPTHKSMVPCSYFLEGKCKFTEDSCRFSHGYLADLHDVQEYIEPDFSKLEAGEKCLAKYEDDIWYKSTIREVYDDTIDVHYDTYDTDAKLDIHFVLPIETIDAESDSSSEYDIDDDNSRDVHEDNYVAQLSRQPLTSVGPLGEWEIHTKGIGSKLMAKMGYVFGKGLGKEGEGRVEPIEIVLLPAGKSLDKVAELRENGKLHKPLKKKKIKMGSMLGEGCSSNQGGSSSEKSDVFAFINKKLTKQDSSSTSECDFEKQKVRHNIEDSYQQLKKNREKKRKGQSTRTEPNKGPNWNVQLLKNNEKALALRKQLSKHKESLKRNLGRDREMVNRLQGSISSIENELQELEQSGKTIENKLNSKAQHKKLTVF